MSGSEKPKVVSNAFHGEGDADNGVVTQSVVTRGDAARRENGSTSSSGKPEEATKSAGKDGEA